MRHFEDRDARSLRTMHLAFLLAVIVGGFVPILPGPTRLRIAAAIILVSGASLCAARAAAERKPASSRRANRPRDGGALVHVEHAPEDLFPIAGGQAVLEEALRFERVTRGDEFIPWIGIRVDG